jgi:hypothetical protein
MELKFNDCVAFRDPSDNWRYGVIADVQGESLIVTTDRQQAQTFGVKTVHSIRVIDRVEFVSMDQAKRAAIDGLKEYLSRITDPDDVYRALTALPCLAAVVLGSEVSPDELLREDEFAAIVPILPKEQCVHVGTFTLKTGKEYLVFREPAGLDRDNETLHVLDESNGEQVEIGRDDLYEYFLHCEQ